MAIYSEFSHQKLWFSIVMLVYQRVRHWGIPNWSSNFFRWFSMKSNGIRLFWSISEIPMTMETSVEYEHVWTMHFGWLLFLDPYPCHSHVSAGYHKSVMDWYCLRVAVERCLFKWLQTRYGYTSFSLRTVWHHVFFLQHIWWYLPLPVWTLQNLDR